MLKPLLYDENVLINKLRAGDTKAFTQLYNAYRPLIYSNILRMVKYEEIAEEIVQDVFARIWHKRETIEFENSFVSYLFRMSQNQAHDFYRKIQRDKILLEKFKEIIIEDYTHIEEYLQQNESQVLLQEALQTLSQQQKRVYHLCKLEGKTYKEAAEDLGISHHTVKEYLSNASHSVKTYLCIKLGMTL